MKKTLVIPCIVIVLCSLLLVVPSTAASIALTATGTPSTVAQGEKIFINGTALGQPPSVAIWILGENFATRVEILTYSDSTFSFQITPGLTNTLNIGQYFIIVQHPMANDIFDVDAPGLGVVTGDVFVYDNAAPGGPAPLFKIQGPGSLRGSDAANALVQGINQSHIDDICIPLQFEIKSSTTPMDVGVFRLANGNWYMDTTKTGVVNKTFHFGTTGDVPVVGDWDGNGISDVGVFRPSTGNWILEITKTGAVYKRFRFGTSGDTPIVGKWV